MSHVIKVCLFVVFALAPFLAGAAEDSPYYLYGSDDGRAHIYVEEFDQEGYLAATETANQVIDQWVSDNPNPYLQAMDQYNIDYVTWQEDLNTFYTNNPAPQPIDYATLEEYNEDYFAWEEAELALHNSSPTMPTAEETGINEWTEDYNAIVSKNTIQDIDYITTSEGYLSVQDPISATNATNKRYVDDQINTINNRVDNLESRIDALGDDFSDLERRTSAGIAAVAAIPDTPRLQAGQGALSMGVGHYNDETAFGISTSRAISNTVQIGAGAAFSTFEPSRPVINASATFVF